ncbi:hypothetical protein [Nonomuraea dietziae]|uniref:hypothetical protein n=1 Tax=Nonomuraea dietziae TaxID=65515 RepID=UPI0034331EC8
MAGAVQTRLTAVIVLCAALVTRSAPAIPPPPPLLVSAPVPLDSGGHSDITDVTFGHLNGVPLAISAGAEGVIRGATW